MHINKILLYLHNTVINLVNILNSANPTDVILNALALEFVIAVDEIYASSVWWDPDSRWLKAGIMELYIQSIFECRVFNSSRLFEDRYGIKSRIIERVCNQGDNLIYDKEVSRMDRNNPEYMTHSEKFDFHCRTQAALLNEPNFEEFTKPSRLFGSLEAIIFGIFHNIYSKDNDGYGLFYRLQFYQTWSRWNKLLFLGDIPRLSGKTLFITFYGLSIKAFTVSVHAF